MTDPINLSTPEDAYKALMGCPLSQYNTIRARLLLASGEAWVAAVLKRTDHSSTGG